MACQKPLPCGLGLKLNRVFNHLSSVGLKQLCALAHLGCTGAEIIRLALYICSFFRDFKLFLNSKLGAGYVLLRRYSKVPNKRTPYVY